MYQPELWEWQNPSSIMDSKLITHRVCGWTEHKYWTYKGATHLHHAHRNIALQTSFLHYIMEVFLSFSLHINSKTQVLGNKKQEHIFFYFVLY